ncbi:MAG: 4Fe-4S binding protein [Clostridia bacterium]|nr:4Fe-4S binding protein [Clostridia bacterium]
MKQLLNAIQETVKREGIDLLGFAPKSRFEALPPETNPFSIFPEGKTVILVGKRICRGSLRGVEEGTNFVDYNLFGKDWLEDEFLALACYGLTNTLEDNGWEAVPIFPNPCELAPTGVSVEEGRPAPNVFPDFDFAAVACGLCELGYNGLPLSPEFGSRQRFHMIITDAELPATPLLTKSICDKCMACAKACPMGAISEECEEIEICGKVMTVAKIDYEKCKQCKNGAVKNRFSAAARPDRIAAVCNRTCMVCLEESKRISNLFEKQFRTAPAWVDGNRGDQK